MTLQRERGSRMAAVDYQAKYEAFLRGVLKDIETKVQTAQQNAEESSKASEHYCHELKLQLQQTSQQVEELQQRLTATKTELETAREQLQHYKDRMPSSGHLGDIAEFMSSLTCLTVSVENKTKEETVYLCRVDDGLLAGHTFTITLNRNSWEYTYEPQETNHLSPDSKFACKFCFPDYMLARFLANLLNATYKQDH